MATAPINVSGVVSGLDTNSIVTQLMAIEQQGLTRLQTKKSTIQQEQAAYKTLYTKASTLQTASQALANYNSALPTTASSTDSTKVTATSSAGATSATYAVTILRQASATVLNGNQDIGSNIDPTAAMNSTDSFGAGFTAGSFSVNGKQIAVAATDSLNTVLANIQNAFNPGDVTATYDNLTDKISITSAAGPILLGSSGDTSNFLSLGKLTSDGVASTTTSSASLGALNTIAPLNASGANGLRSRTAVTDGGAGAGQFNVNGVAISFNASTDALTDILARINNSAAGVSASYDKLTDRIVLKNRDGGSNNISVTDTTGNFASALGLTGSATLGQSAQITIAGVNGGNPISSADNIFTESETGITGLSITAVAGSGTASVSVGADTAGITSAFQKFVTAYNDISSYITQQAGITGTGKDAKPGILHDDLGLRQFAQKMRELVGSSAPGITGATNNLAGIGLGTTGSSATLSLDTSKLTAALQNNPGAFKTLVSDPTNGIMANFNKYLSTQTNFGLGPLGTKADSLQPSVARLDDSITRYNRYLTSKEAQLRTQFSNMETALANIQGGASKLLTALGG